jgi:electron transport complex protein RnfA
MIALALFALFLGLSLNLVFQMGLRPEEEQTPAFSRAFELCIVVILLWCLFSYVLTPLDLGFAVYFLIFPLVVVFFYALDRLGRRLFPHSSSSPSPSINHFPYSALAVSASVLTLRLASSFASALIVAGAFSLGIFCSILLIRAIRLRSAYEHKPALLRGAPLLFISSGLLAVLIYALAVVLFEGVVV